MVRLEYEDRKKLTSILETLPLLGNYESRRQILISAGLETIIPQIDLHGSAFVVVGNMIEVLEHYGRISTEHEALGRLLNRLKELVGADDETQGFFDYLLLEYDLMIPSKSSKEPIEWKMATNSETVYEKIVGENTLRDIAFLKRGYDVASSVIYIEIPNQWSGTGFMVSPNLLITNNHVIPDIECAQSAVYRFNYQSTFDGSMEISEDYKAQTQGVFHTSAELDYTLVALDSAPGSRWGYVKLKSNSPVKKDCRVNIIQHPAGLPKQVSIQNNLVAYADSHIIQYYTSTLGGASGAPVFNDRWEVVAVHHAGGMLFEPNSKRKYFRNEGISVTAILNDLPENIKLSLK